MNQEKIGKFISKCRRENNLTQEQLANKLGISDRAVSKWERGLNLPDASLLIDLSNILGVTVTEILSGEKIDDKEYMKKAEENLIEMAEVKENLDKELLTLEIVLGVISIILLLSLTFVAAFIEMKTWLRITLIIIGFIPAIIGVLFGLRIEQIAGYYECNKCHHKYIPTYLSVLWAMHINRTRYMKCPKCHKRSWHKKVLK